MNIPARFLAADSRIATRAAIQRRLHNVSGEKYTDVSSAERFSVLNALKRFFFARLTFAGGKK